HQQGTANQAGADSTPQGREGQLVDLGVSGAQGGNQAEEDEDVYIAQATVAVRVLAAGVAPGSEDRGNSNQQQRPRRGEHNQNQPADRGQAEAAEGGVAYVLRCGELGTGQAQRAHAFIIGAADAIGVVVGVVHPYLQQ